MAGNFSSTDPVVRLLSEHPLTFICAWSQEAARPCPRHDHPVMELVYHPSGQGVTALDDGTTLSYAEGGVVAYTARVAHDQTPTLKGTEVCVQLKVPKSISAHWPKATYYPPVSDPYVGEEFWSLSRTATQPDPALRAVLNLRVTALLLRLHASSHDRDAAVDPQADYLQRARNYLQTHFATVPHVAAVADHVGVSEDYLRHLFREREGTSINQEMNRLRVERAKDLLRHSRLPLKAVAEQCGFQNERYFCTRFLALAGLTPGAFRNQPRGPRPPPLPGEPPRTT
jgi:AraC-like DNA-binding protein